MNGLMMKPPVYFDDDWFEKWADLFLNLKENYDFESGKWINLPFSGGFLDQMEINPKVWQALNYMITVVYKKRGQNG